MKKLLCFALCLTLLFSCSAPALAAGNAQTDTVQDILDRSRANDESCETTVQQQANAAYRLTELLALIAAESTDSDANLELISGIRDNLYGCGEHGFRRESGTDLGYPGQSVCHGRQLRNRGSSDRKRAVPFYGVAVCPRTAHGQRRRILGHRQRGNGAP